MANRIELDDKGIEALLRSAGVKADLERRAAAVARTAGPGHEYEVVFGRDRYRASIWTETRAARKAEANSHSLLAAVSAAAL